MKKQFAIVILMLIAANLFAQVGASSKKLPTTQEASVWAPTTVKIDGKLGEWNDNFQAYNRNTRLLYIMANDDKKLYLTVKSSDFTTTAKIISGGVNLTINTDGKKKSKDGYSVTFPIIVHPERLAGGLGNRFGNRNAGADTELMKAVHERTIIAAKQIRVLGFKNITDTLISIYNEHGIKTALNFDGANMTLEMAIPLELLGISTDNPKEFAYNIILSGFQVNNGNNGGGGGPPGGGGGGGRNALDFMDLVTPSDFWGKYTLAKK